MKVLTRCLFVAALGFATAVTTAIAAQPAEGPPVKLIVPFPAGGTVDGLARMLQPALSATLGQTVIVENKSGAGGRIGTAEAVRAPADGNTIVMIYDNYATDPIFHKDLPYDPWKDLTPVTLMARAPMVAIATAKAPYSTLQELVVYAKANPGKVDFGSTGVGSSSHLTGELFAHHTGTQMFHVPYKGGAPAATDLLGGSLQLFWGTIPYAKAQAATGRAKLLGQTGARRAKALPDVPTLAEQGLKDIEIYGWAGFMLPAGTPPTLVQRWAQAIHTAVTKPEIGQRLDEMGFEVAVDNPTAFADFLRRENHKWANLIKAAGISIQ